MGFVEAAVRLPLINRAARSFFPRPGDGPSLKVQEEGWLRQDIIAREKQSQSRKRYVMWSRGDPGYKCTALMLCESALALADISKEEENKQGALLASENMGSLYKSSAVEEDPCKGVHETWLYSPIICRILLASHVALPYSLVRIVLTKF